MFRPCCTSFVIVHCLEFVGSLLSMFQVGEFSLYSLIQRKAFFLLVFFGGGGGRRGGDQRERNLPAFTAFILCSVFLSNVTELLALRHTSLAWFQKIIYL